ncbi:hypothetical protein PaecuDRAFT_3142 [Paenibacillus curdlanolyticus YK9]|uniref:Uncharacterized protein n=1 Tax=Paenibacillus curdlanolyticus YK9 TaxID=717606 RepID=E0IBV3_9BACL|nr:hypothetical protein [Paenibacillus curdlanolyticus]EFM10183.1 hypothetical protein PaecuDRAFT_3142 [Paenibacillus curdlanolyticus YK9]
MFQKLSWPTTNGEKKAISKTKKLRERYNVWDDDELWALKSYYKSSMEKLKQPALFAVWVTAFLGWITLVVALINNFYSRNIQANANAYLVFTFGLTTLLAILLFYISYYYRSTKSKLENYQLIVEIIDKILETRKG